jgi:hypothetical protein
MSEQQYHGDRYGKEEEKAEKDHGDEKDWDEKWHRDPLSAARWAAILIWAGLALLLENLEMLTRFETLEAWDLIFAGAGLILLLEVVVRVLLPAYRRPVTGSIIVGVVLLALGVGSALGVSLVWPLVLIAIGLLILLRGVFPGR